MKVNLLCGQNSALCNFAAQLRSVEIQKDSMRFRKNLERISEITAYEVSKTLDYDKTTVQTSLGIAECSTIAEENIVIASIMRAAMPMHQGMLGIFDRAQNAFISVYRKTGKDNKFTINLSYISAVPTDGKTLIICDPMIATGASMLVAYNALIEYGLPQATHIVSIIASRDGIEYLKKNLPDSHSVTLWVCAIDNELTAKAYIVPGLGDAGDLAFGQKYNPS
jgi:uracil phosphoribosyltransferase